MAWPIYRYLVKKIQKQNEMQHDRNQQNDVCPAKTQISQSDHPCENSVELYGLF